jgi:hypothetical protein
MYCPRCGEERVSNATSFCSRCGFLLTVASELLPTGGALPPTLLPVVSASPSDRSRGLKQGLFLFLLALVVFPLMGILSVFALGMRPWPAGVVLFLLAGGGILRMAYALMFESKSPNALAAGSSLHVADVQLPGHPHQGSLPPQQTYPASQYTSPEPRHWRDTNELEPASVTDGTTKLLEKESEPPA